ncbi:hypothetical protein AB1Y20_018488 [Prymnesium parvum]|uniref:Uncharacterized protein n=1 Tax=Prymnesium parvum TaxID=97485 RepID=A0AB34JRS0_PRYPA
MAAARGETGFMGQLTECRDAEMRVRGAGEVRDVGRHERGGKAEEVGPGERAQGWARVTARARSFLRLSRGLTLSTALDLPSHFPLLRKITLSSPRARDTAHTHTRTRATWRAESATPL